MDARTREALEASIRHWEKNASADSPADISVNWRDCALCRLFFKKHDCAGCPVKHATRQTNCRGTPYYDVVNARRAWNLDQNNSELAEACKTASAAELDFLRSLLSTEEA